METTRVAIVMDQSGSMVSIEKEAKTSFIEQLQTLRNLSANDSNLKFLLTVVLFSNTAEVVYADAPIEIASDISESYRPDGGTALNDSVMLAIDSVEKTLQEDEAALIVIITDGHENASKTKRPDLAERIQALQNKGNWTFTYMCTSDNLAEVAAKYNIPAANTSGFVHSATGMLAMSADNSSMLRGYGHARTGGAMSISNAYSPDLTSSVSPTPLGSITPAGDAFGDMLTGKEGEKEGKSAS